VPAPIVEVIKRGLARFSSDAKFRALTAQVQKVYGKHTESIRRNTNLLALYETRNSGLPMN